MMLTSLRQRLVFFILTGIFLIWSLIIVKIYQDSRTEIFELFDAHLAQSAKVLLFLVAEELYEEHDEEEGVSANDTRPIPIQEIEQHLEKHKYEKILAFQIWVERLDFYFKSAIAPEKMLATGTRGFSVNIIDGITWRVFTISDPQQIIIIHVGEPVSVRTELLEKITWNLILPVLIALPLLALFIWWVIGRTLAPLSDLAVKIRHRPHNRTTRITPEGKLPDEARPLLDAINQLLDRLNETLESERRFTADVAHELRTPLAGIKTQAQLAMHTNDKTTRSTAMHRIVRSIDRCTHMTEQLLAMARLDPDYTLGSLDKILLNDVAHTVIAELDDIAREKHVHIKTEFRDKCIIQGNSQTLHVMLRNLVDNAIRYGNDNGHIQISLETDGDLVILCIDDDGPGIADEQLPEVFNRFYRIDNTSEKGSGLGLSITKRIADLHGADMKLSRSDAGGLRVTIVFRNKHNRQDR
jgi:two-component system sensor histidine kinase QseC